MGTIEEAREYARNGMSLCMDTSDEQDIYCEDLIQAYLAGAEDKRKELTTHYETEIAAYQKVIKEGLEREKIAKDIIVEKRKEITRLTRWNDIETDKDGFATSESLDAIFDRLPRLVKDSRSGEIELIDYDNAPEWRGDIERKPSRYRWLGIHE